MMELRDIIKDEVWVAVSTGGGEDYWTTEECGLEIADRILAIPEIAEALRIKRDYDEARLGPSV